MTAFDDVLDALVRSSAELTELGRTVDPTVPSYDNDWSIAQVYSHLGSAAEIGLNLVRSSFGEAEKVEPTTIWDRWNALSPEQMVAGFADADRTYLEYLSSVDPARNDEPAVGFFTGPISTTDYLRFRLQEHTLHSWDVRIALDPAAEVSNDGPRLTLNVVVLPLVRMLGNKEAAVAIGTSALAVDVGARRLLLEVSDADGGSVGLRDADGGDEPTGELTISPPAFARLLSGRLDPDHTPEGVESSGTPTLDQVRSLFPGY